MKALITKATVLAGANGLLLGVTASMIAAFSGTSGALAELLLPLYCFFGGMLTAGLLAGGGIVLDWDTRTTTPVEAIFSRATARAIIVTSAMATAAGCITLVLAVSTILSFA
ncbi:hypothetical protein [Devosia sp.]|uniref:hypothetical protein n=1 Tax=Devosia sp. TaxID=1871048 RepID=UPI001AC63D9B|nr:hypothetical protein [Devosia sp.]MBN9331909.1 hypothetical protein [Devosia sp.]